MSPPMSFWWLLCKLFVTIFPGFNQLNPERILWPQIQFETDFKNSDLISNCHMEHFIIGADWKFESLYLKFSFQ